LIPPSLIMILYCVVAKTFIFDLFTAAVIPALLTILGNLAAVMITVRLDPQSAPVSPRLPWNRRLAALRRAIPALALMAAIFGGLYSGVFTINEAASVAAVLSFGFAVMRRRMTWEGLVNSLCQAAGASIMLYMILIGTLAHLPESMISLIGGLHLPPVGVIILLLLAYIVLGSVFDEVSAILITLPFVLPVVVALGYDPIWWGVVNVIQVELAMIHPPLGIIVFLLHGIAPDIPMRTIYRGVLPFIIADFAVLALLVAFPDLALWLPRVLG
jgi:tripartite ATP-independent transporter DctM subunit